MEFWNWLFEGWISNGRAFGYGYSPNHLKTIPFEIRTFLSRFQMVFDKMAPICLDFKWLGFRISDHIPNSDHLHATQPLFDHLKSRIVRSPKRLYVWIQCELKIWMLEFESHSKLEPFNSPISNGSVLLSSFQKNENVYGCGPFKNLRNKIEIKCYKLIRFEMVRTLTHSIIRIPNTFGFSSPSVLVQCKTETSQLQHFLAPY